MCFPVSYAGFFAKSQIMFFLLSSFRFLPPFKNDGRSELRFGMVLADFLYTNKEYRMKAVPACYPYSGEADTKEERIHNFA